MAASTWSTSTAAVKQLAPEGVYDANVEEAVKFNMTPKDTSLGGLPWRVAINNEWGQGRGGTIPDALANLNPSSLVQFQIQNSSAQPYEYFGTARVKGSVLRGATKSGAGVADIWDLEMKNTTLGVKTAFAVNQYLDGTGVIGVISSGSATATITLTVPQHIVRFSIGQSIQLVSGAALVSGGARAVITGLDRDAGTITFGAVLPTYIAGAADAQSIVNAGDYNVWAYGDQSWVGSSATLYGLTRTTDPIKLGGHLYNASGLSPMEAFANATALVDTYGQVGKLAIVNNKKLSDWKKLMDGKTVYSKTTVQSKVASIGYGGIEFEGPNGTIKIIGDRLCPYTDAWLVNETDGPEFKSFGDIAQILDFDSLEFQRDPLDDSYTIRIGSYYLYGYNGNLVGQCRISNFMT